MQLCDVPGSELQKMYSNKQYLWKSDSLQSPPFKKTGEIRSQIIGSSLREMKEKVFGLISYWYPQVETAKLFFFLNEIRDSEPEARVVSWIILCSVLTALLLSLIYLQIESP